MIVVVCIIYSLCVYGLQSSFALCLTDDHVTVRVKVACILMYTMVLKRAESWNRSMNFLYTTHCLCALLSNQMWKCNRIDGFSFSKCNGNLFLKCGERECQNLFVETPETRLVSDRSIHIVQEETSLSIPKCDPISVHCLEMKLPCTFL